MQPLARVALLLGTCLCAGSLPEAAAQQFGRNKVEYVDFDFQVLRTEHFSVYHYPSEEETARIAARLAERWYTRLSTVLGHDLTGRQALILYGSHPEFAQTNVIAGFLDDGIAGVTESARRRIVMPFAPTLEETDRILGHELTHAFQFDMSRRYRGGVTWPLWAVEGMAQYLALGSRDADAAMWLRDAARFKLLPERQHEAARKFSPYRFGHAFWAYLAGRFGDQVIADVLKAKGAGTLPKRIRKVTGLDLEELYTQWRAAAFDRYAGEPAAETERSPLLQEGARGRLYLGPALSPDGRQAVFFSEKDRLSLDLFLADTVTGRITRKLATTAAGTRFESLEAIRSSGSWDRAGDRFVFSAVDKGRPMLVVLDMRAHRVERRIPLPRFGQVLTPSWSPDGNAIAFAALDGGITDLYVHDLASGRLRQITDDPFADLQPAWSPDGRTIAFVSDRFATDLSALTFNGYTLALADVATGAIRALPRLDAARHMNPQWSADGSRLYFVSNPDGVSNVFELHVASGAFSQITRVTGGVAGLALTSPALSLAARAPIMAVSVFRAGRYEIELHRGAGELTAGPVAAAPAAGADSLLPLARVNGVVDTLLQDSSGLPQATRLPVQTYEPRMFLEAIGPPYISSGGGPFGTFIRGGGSLLFSDLLGERKLGLSAQAGNRLRDMAFSLRFINRARRWNWGGVAEIHPSLRGLPRRRLHEQEGQPAITRETHYFERTHFRLAAYAAYPLNRAQRVEAETGVRHIDYRSSVSSTSRSLTTGRVLSRTFEDAFGGHPATFGEASAAFVHDTAVLGPTSPILGGRARFEVASTWGELSSTRVTVDYRRYLMPVRPYTIAARVMHLGQYGADVGDLRLLPTFLGSRAFLRGYGWGSLRCAANQAGECTALDELLGSRLAVANLELRAPVLGLRSRDLRYGPLPVEAFLFADSGAVWGPSPAVLDGSPARRVVSSFGAGARLNAFGLPLELAAVRAVDAPARGWSFGLSLRRGF